VRALLPHGERTVVCGASCSSEAVGLPPLTTKSMPTAPEACRSTAADGCCWHYRFWRRRQRAAPFGRNSDERARPTIGVLRRPRVWRGSAPPGEVTRGPHRPQDAAERRPVGAKSAADLKWLF